jgi:hypothetical protein
MPTRAAPVGSHCRSGSSGLERSTRGTALSAKRKLVGRMELELPVFPLGRIGSVRTAKPGNAYGRGLVPVTPAIRRLRCGFGRASLPRPRESAGASGALAVGGCRVSAPADELAERGVHGEPVSASRSRIFRESTGMSAPSRRRSAISEYPAGTPPRGTPQESRSTKPMPGSPAPMQCTSCSHENRPTARFCEDCGGPLARPCESCGTELRRGAKFCDECGTPTNAKPTDARRAPSDYTPRHLAD